MLTILSVFLGNPDLLLSAARFTTRYVRLVGEESAPCKCVLLSTSKPGMVICGPLSLMSEIWVGIWGTTFRGWSSTLAARVRLVISRLALVFVLPLGFSW